MLLSLLYIKLIRDEILYEYTLSGYYLQAQQGVNKLV